MGNCCLSQEEQEQRVKNQAIDKQLQNDQLVQAKVVKILLLGKRTH
jgi:hypothetical protein